jgi:hypothetical protein
VAEGLGFSDASATIGPGVIASPKINLMFLASSTAGTFELADALGANKYAVSSCWKDQCHRRHQEKPPGFISKKTISIRRHNDQKV